MKRAIYVLGLMVVCLGLILKFLPSSPAMAETQFLLKEDFNYDAGALNNADKLGDLWTVYNQDNKGIVEMKEETGGNKYLHLQNFNGTNKGKVSVFNSTPLEQQTGLVTAELRVRRSVGVESTATYPELRIFNSKGTMNATQGTWDPTRPNAGVVAINKGFWTINNTYVSSTPQGNHKNSGAAMEAGKWYNLTLVGNLSAKTYDFYVDGKLYQRNEAMREHTASGSTVDWFAIMAMQILDTNANADLDFDYLYAYSGQPRMNAGISSLSATGNNGIYTPTFNQATGVYTVNDVVDNSVTLTITPNAQSVNSVGKNESLAVSDVTLNDAKATKVSDTSYTASVDLVEGENTIPIVLTAADGVTKQTYLVKMTKPSSQHASPRAYYISNDGDDSSPGTKDQPWKTIDRVNQDTYIPGDSILFKAGDVWEDAALVPKGSGTADFPITIGMYGEGKRPYLKGNGQTYNDPYFNENVKDNYKDANGVTQTAYLHENVGNVIRLHNQQHWTIQDLEITNTVDGFTGTRGEDNGSKLRDLRGIHISGDNGQELAGFTFQRLYIHDVTGFVRWIGNSLNESGIIGRGGWNVSKRTGGILMETMLGDGEHPTTFKDVTLQDSRLDNNSFGGFTIKQWSKDSMSIGNGGTAKNDWAARSNNAPPEYSDPSWAPHSNIKVLNNTFDQGGSDYALNAIYITSSKDVLVQGNTIRKPGVCGIELYYVDHAVVEKNEIWGSQRKAGGGDSNAIDPDGWTSNITIQYNFIHDNGDGILFCGFGYNSVIVRYNLIKDNNEIVLRDSTGDGLIQIYNNVIYQDKKMPGTLANGSGNDQWNIRNNVFYSTTPITADKFSGKGVDNSNLFYNVKVPSALGNDYKSEDPLFAGPAPQGYDTLPANGEHLLPHLDWSSLKPQPGSPLIGNGVAYTHIPTEINVQPNGLDAAGVQIGDAPSIGLFEATFAGTLAGKVTNSYGETVEGVSVEVKQDDQTIFSTVTDAQGRYKFEGLEKGTYTFVTAKEGYEGSSQVLTVTDSTGAINLSVGNLLASERTVTGKVTALDGSMLEGAAVSIILNGIALDSSITKADGQFSLTAPVGDSYSLKATKAGYLDKVQKGINVKAESGNTFNFTLRSVAESTLLEDNFNSYDLGDFVENDVWGVTGVSGNVLEVVQDPDNAENKILHMKRNGGSSYFGIYNKSAFDADGQLTISMRIKRAAGSSGQYALYSYSDSVFTPTINTGTGSIANIVTNAGKIRTHNVRNSSNTVDVASYTADTWYDISIVADMEKGTFDFYVDGVKFLEDQPLRTWSETLDRLLIFSSDGSGDFYVDDIKAYLNIPDVPVDQTPPAEVADQKVTAGDGKLTISWTDPIDSDLASIKITGSAETVIEPITLNKGIGTYTFNSLSNGQNYEYLITTLDAQGNESSGVIVSGTPKSSGNNNTGGGGSTGTDTSNVVSTNGQLTLPAGRTGEVALNNEIKIEIPANAIEKDLKVTIDKVLNTEGLVTDKEVLLSQVFEVLKNYPDNFKNPVTLTLVFDPSKVDSDQKVAIYYYDELKKAWVEVGGTVNGDKITATVNHFTKFAVLAVDKSTDGNVQFSDISGHWAEAAIQQAVSSGITKGYPDGTFRPNQEVTRAEFTVMLMNMLGLDDKGASLPFKDTSKIGAWAKEAVTQAVEAGIINGYNDGTFRPDDKITRAEMAVMIAKALKLTTAEHAVTGFTDEKDIPAWAHDSVAALKERGIVNGTNKNQFVPNASTTRAEAVTVLMNLLKYND